MANTPVGTKDRPWSARISALNGESANAFAAGEVAVVKVSSPGQAVKPSTAGAAQTPSFFLGIATNAAAIGEPVEILVGGYVPNARYIHRSRAASSDSWASVASAAIGDYCTVNTVYNGVVASGAGAAAAAGNMIALMESIASLAGVATATSDTALVSSSFKKVWIRNLG